MPYNWELKEWPHFRYSTDAALPALVKYSEKALAQGLGRPVLMSLSRSLAGKRGDYYEQLQNAQSSLDVTEWITYFSETVLDAQKEALEWMGFTLKKKRFYETYRKNLNSRQLKLVNRMLDAGLEGFEGEMTARKAVSLTKVSKATVTRDLQSLVEMGVFLQAGEGRSAHYSLVGFESTLPASYE